MNTVVNTTPLVPNAKPSFEVRRKTEAGWETTLKTGNREFAHLVVELGPQELARRANAYDAAVSALRAVAGQVSPAEGPVFHSLESAQGWAQFALSKLDAKD